MLPDVSHPLNTMHLYHPRAALELHLCTTNGCASTDKLMVADKLVCLEHRSLSSFSNRTSVTRWDLNEKQWNACNIWCFMYKSLTRGAKIEMEVPCSTGLSAVSVLWHLGEPSAEQRAWDVKQSSKIRTVCSVVKLFAWCSEQSLR